MIRLKCLMSSIKSGILMGKNQFTHKIDQSWLKQFEQNAKVQHLQKLLQQNKIHPYFIQKKIQQLQKQDIYFYMQNKQIFCSLPLQTKKQLIKNPNLTTPLKFHLAQQINSLHIRQVQKYLLQTFNNQIDNLTTKDIQYCLEVISNFRIQKNVDFFQLQKKIILEEQPENFLKLLFYLIQFKYIPEIIDSTVIHHRIDHLKHYSVQNILHVKEIAKICQVQLSQDIQSRLRTSFLGKRKSFSEQQGSSMVFLLQYYPQQANSLNLSNMSCFSYIMYLKLFLLKGNPILVMPAIQSHPIPQKVITSSQQKQFLKVIQKRIQLQIDTIQTICLELKRLYTKDLGCIYSYLSYLHKNKCITPQIESTFQRSFFNKVVKNGQNAFQQFHLLSVFQVISHMSLYNIGTIDFWKKTLGIVTNAIENSSNYKHLKGEQQKKFVVQIFRIFSQKPFPRELQQKVINLTLLSLAKNKWAIQDIFLLSTCLRLNYIGHDELWFGIEQRMNQINLKVLKADSHRRWLKVIVNNFNVMRKGSYEFWEEINQNLTIQEKHEILKQFKVPSSIAHAYLKC